MKSLQPRPTRRRRPWVVIAATAFLGYAGFVSLPMLVLGQGGNLLTAMQVALSFAAFFALLPGSWRPTFHLARATLALWAARGLYAVWQMIAAPWFSGVGAPSHPPLIQGIMVLGAGALCGLFWLYGFGRRSREFYGLPPLGTGGGIPVKL